MNKGRLPPYATVIGAGTEILGNVRFRGGLHLEGRVVGDVTGQAEPGCALTLGASGVIEGNLTAAHVIIDGTVVGDVRASDRAELGTGARIQGAVFYGLLEMDEGAEVNGRLVHVAGANPPQLQQQSDDAAEPPDPARET